MMSTAGTEHLTAGEFEAWVETPRSGERSVDATGMLAAAIHTAFQAEHSNAVRPSWLRESAWKAGIENWNPG
jgi:hypothetical protein